MEQLTWLLHHPDFAGTLKSARMEADPAQKLSRLMELAGCRRDFVATEKLDRTLLECVRQIEPTGSPEAPPLQQARLALLSSHTVDHLLPGIRVAALSRRIALSLHAGLYGLYRQSLMAPDPALAAFAP